MNEELVNAVREGDLETVRRLLDAGAEMQTQDNEGRPMLVLAARSGHTAIVELLLDRGADIETPGKRGATALVTAATQKHPEVVRLLIQRGADLNASGMMGITALAAAALRQNIEIATLLLDAGADPEGRGGNRPLRHAVFCGCIELVRLLLARGADPNNPDALGSTPLASAAMRNHIEIARILLDSGADVNATAKSFTPLGFAIGQNNPEMASLLLERGAIDRATDQGVSATSMAIAAPQFLPLIRKAFGTDLHEAASEGDLPLVLSLLDANPEVDRRDYRQRTALFMAAKGGHEECVRALLDRGADPSAVIQHQHTSLIEAAAKGETAIVRLLLERGADVRATNQWGQSALFRAAMGGHAETAAALREAGAPMTLADAALLGDRESLNAMVGAGVDQRDEAGMTALMGASASGRGGLVQELLDRGADIEACDKRGVTPLAHAVNKGHLEIAEILLNSGARVDPNAASSQSLLKVPVMTDRQDVVRLLLDRGASPNLGDRLGYPLLWAIQADKPEMMALLLDRGAHPDGPSSKSEQTPATLESDSSSAMEIPSSDLSQATGLDETHVRLRTPLLESIHSNRPELVRLLLGRGANPSHKGEWHETPLTAAAGQGNLECVTALLDAGATVKEEGGLGPLAAAAVKGHTKVLEVLMKRAGPGSLTESVDGFPRGLAPLILGAALGNKEILDLFTAGGTLQWPQPLQDMIQKIQTARRETGMDAPGEETTGHGRNDP